MFEFFIALFGGTFCLSKIKAEKAGTKSFDRNSSGRLMVLNKIRLRHNMPFSYKWYDIQKNVDERIRMIDDVSEELQNIFGIKWRKMYEEYIRNYTGIKPDVFIKYWMNTDGGKAKGNLWGVAYNIWLSKKGFVDTNGWHLVAYKKNFCGGLPVELFYDDIQNESFAKKYINTILSNLKNHHPDLGLTIRCRDNMVYVITCQYGDLNLSNY